MGRIKVGTRNGKKLYGVCGMLGGIECALFNANETLLAYPGLRKWDRSLYTCAHDVQFTRIVTI
jgi:hypothetical protein